MNDLEGHPRSSKLPLFDRLCITYYSGLQQQQSVLHRFLYNTKCTAYVTSCDFEMSFSFSCNYKPRAISDSCVNISYLMYAIWLISLGMGATKALYSKCDLQGHSRSLVLVPFDSMGHKRLHHFQFRLAVCFYFIKVVCCA